VADASIRIPVEARDRLAEVAAAEGLSLRAYLARLAGSVLTPAERAEHAARARELLRAWSSYDPGAVEEERLDAVLDQCIAEANQRIAEANQRIAEANQRIAEANQRIDRAAS
jgi:hypothetical protein